MKPQDNSANMQNPNKGTDGVNKQNAQKEGNRGAQLNPNKGGGSNKGGGNKGGGSKGGGKK